MWNRTLVDGILAGQDGAQPQGQCSAAADALNATVGCLLAECYCQAMDERDAIMRFDGVVTVEDIQDISNLAVQIGGTARRTFGRRNLSDDSTTGVSGHMVTFLRPRFEKELPELFEKLRSHAVRANDEAGWGIVDHSKLNPRTIELLFYSKPDDGGDADQLGWHTDKQSAVTLLAMLSDPDDYEGGELQHEVCCPAGAGGGRLGREVGRSRAVYVCI